MTDIEKRISAVESALQMTGFESKEVLTFDEVAKYTGLSKSYLYSQPL